MFRKFLIAAALALMPLQALAQSAITLPIAANAVADIGNGPVKVRMVAGNASIFTSQGSGVGSTSGSSTTLTLTGTPATAPIVGGLISGTGITSGTTITAYNGTTGVTLSAAMTVAGGTAVAWGAACPSTPPSNVIQASPQADYYVMYTQARVCAVSPGGPVNTLLIDPIFYDQTSIVAGVLSEICTTPGAFPVYNAVSAAWVCSTAGGSSAHLGATSDIYDFWVARPAAVAGTVLQMQDGKGGNLRTLTGASTTGINFQSLVDTTASGFTYASISIDTQCQAGTGGSCTGINIVTQNNSTWTPGGGALPGAIAVEATGKSTRGGHVWGSDWTGWCLTVAAVECYGIEVNVRNDIAATAQASGIWLVNENSVVPTAGSGILISAQASNVGFPTAGLYFSTVAGFYPLTTAASLIKSDVATLVNGVDLENLTFTGTAFIGPSLAGGTGAASSLVLESTAGAGTTDAIQFKTASQVVRGSISSGGLWVIGPTPTSGTGFLWINPSANSASTSAPVSSTGLHISGADGSPNIIGIDSYGGVPTIINRRADGTAVSKTGLVANDVIGTYTGSGWTSAGAYSLAAASIRMIATETWSGTANGSQIDFRTTPNGTTTITTDVSVFNSGGVGVGTATDPGAGKLGVLTAFNVGSNQVVGARITGYAAMTGSPDKATSYATSTVTLAQLAGRVMQLQADLTTHGLIGP